MRAARFAAAALLVAAQAGCKKEQPAPTPPPAPAAPSISSLDLGHAIGADKRITTSQDTFGLRDTIYVSIATNGTGDNAKLKAVWTFGADTVRADSQTLNLAGPATSEFHISRPRAWHAGAYRIAVTLNNRPVQTRGFFVR